MACSLSSRIRSTLVSMDSAACAVADLTALAACAAVVLADARRSVALWAAGLSVVLIGAPSVLLGCGCMRRPCHSQKRVRPRGGGGPADQGQQCITLGRSARAPAASAVVPAADAEAHAQRRPETTPRCRPGGVLAHRDRQGRYRRLAGAAVPPADRMVSSGQAPGCCPPGDRVQGGPVGSS